MDFVDSFDAVLGAGGQGHEEVFSVAFDGPTQVELIRELAPGV